MTTDAFVDDNQFVSHAGPAAHALTLLAYGSRGHWPDTIETIHAIHNENGESLARAFAVFYQMIKYQQGARNSTDRIARSLSLLGREEYAAIRVADVLLHRLAVDDTPGFADAWDGVRFAFGGRNVVPVAAAVLMITLGALEPEDKDAVVLLDRLTTDGAFTALLQSFGMGNQPVTTDNA
jgi:hypothetical protein